MIRVRHKWTYETGIAMNEMISGAVQVYWDSPFSIMSNVVRPETLIFIVPAPSRPVSA